MPLSATNLKVSSLVYTIRTKEHQKVFENNAIISNRLNLTYTDQTLQVRVSDNWNSLNFLLVEKDTFSLDCQIEVLPILDTLVLYGHAIHYNFLNCKHNLKYLGIFYSNEKDSTFLRQKYPDMDQDYWCFPMENFIQRTYNSKSLLGEIKLGDNALCLHNGTLVKSRVNAIEYHFNSSVLLEHLVVFDELSCRGNPIERPLFHTTFTSTHPLNISNVAKPISSVTVKDFIQSTNGPISFNSFSSLQKGYSGTLINVRTEEGNFFINGINFMNK
jgi:hypothetical protein